MRHQQIANSGEVLPRDIDRRAALRVLGVVLRPAHSLGSRNQQLQAGKVTPWKRQVGNGPLIKNSPNFRAVSLKLRGAVVTVTLSVAAPIVSCRSTLGDVSANLIPGVSTGRTRTRTP